MDIRIRDSEACEPQSYLLWDTVWVQEPLTTLTAEGGFGDWSLADADEPGNGGGLRAKAALHTATLICLFTDRRAPDDADLPDTSDARGWWGDSIPFDVDPYEREMGSHLWMLERGTLSTETELIAKEMAEQALAVLAEQGIVARTEVETEADLDTGQLAIGVSHFSRDGAEIYAQRFAVIWGQFVVSPEAQTLTRETVSALQG